MEITEVKKAKNNDNVEYIEAKELNNKKTVYSLARFSRIKASNDDKKLSLKIGRYKKSEWFGHYLETGVLEENNPKSELTLDDIELKNLVDYINENYYPLMKNENKYISLDDESANILIRENPEYISKLINVAILNDVDLSDVNKLIEIVDRKKAIELFKENYKNDVLEKEWQKWFQQNGWVFGSEFVNIKEDRRIDVENIADFIVENIDGFIDVIEIKRVSLSTNFFDSKKDHGNLIPSNDLIKAITQLSNYLLSLEKRANEKDTTRRLGNILKPRGILIFGSSKAWNEEEYEAFRLLNSSLTNISIYTYDMVLRRAIKMNEYLVSTHKK